MKENNPYSYRQTESGIFVPESAEIVQEFSYKDWDRTRMMLQPGSLLNNIPPRELFTTQEWLDIEKMWHAKQAQREGTLDAFTVMGIIFQHKKEHMGLVPVVLEGNHRTINAANTGQRVNLLIVDHDPEKIKDVWCITNLRNRYGGSLR